MFVLLNVFSSNLLHYRALSCKSLVTVEVKPQVMGGPAVKFVLLNISPSILLHYRALSCKSLVTVEVKPQIREALQLCSCF